MGKGSKWHSLVKFVCYLMLAYSGSPGWTAEVDPVVKAARRGEDVDLLWDFIARPEDYEAHLDLLAVAPKDAEGREFSLSTGYGIWNPPDSTGNTYYRGMCRQSNGRFLYVGTYVFSGGGSEDLVIVRTFDDGTFDASFGTNGRVAVSGGSGAERGHAIALQTDGKVIAVGKTDTGNSNRFDAFVVRLNSNGSLDTSFATTGSKNYSTDSNGDVARAVTIQTDGKILISGYTWYYHYYHSFVARLNTDGTYDTSFAGQGWTRTSFGTFSDGISRMALQTNGNIVTAGSTWNGSNWDVGIIRFATNGSLDTSFKTTGQIVQSIGTLSDTAQGIALDTIGRIVVAGSTSDATSANWLLLRYQSDGTLDTSFRTNGKVIDTMSTTGPDEWDSVAIQTDGKLIVAGIGFSTAADATYPNRIVTGRYNTDGTLDTALKTVGFNSWSSYSSILTNQVIIADGYYAVGWAVSGTTYGAVSRMNTDGTWAASGAGYLPFGTQGLKVVDIGSADVGYAITQATDGSILVGGTSGTDFVLIRLLSSGDLDTAFKTVGYATTNFAGGDIAYAIYQQTDGKVVLAGETGTHIMAVARYNSNGSADTSFFTTGQLTLSQFTYGNSAAMTVGGQSNGDLVLIGYDAHAIAVAVLTSSGNFDTSFNTVGRILTTNLSRSVATDAGHANALAGLVLSTDQIIAAGFDGYSDTSLAMVRYLTSGVLDTTFCTTGIVLTSIATVGAKAFAIGIDSSGRILLGGETTGLYTTLVRYFSDGSLDTSFNTTGKHTGSLTSLRALKVTNSGKTAGVGYSAGATASDFLIQRVGSNGNFDGGYSNSGRRVFDNSGSESFYSVTLMTDGQYCFSGTTTSDANIAIYCVWQ